MENILLLVVTELDVERVPVVEAEADAPLIVDCDGMLPGAIALQGVQPVARRGVEVGEMGGDVRRFQHDYPTWRYSFDLRATVAEMVAAAAERYAAQGRGRTHV